MAKIGEHEIGAITKKKETREKILLALQEGEFYITYMQLHKQEFTNTCFPEKIKSPTVESILRTCMKTECVISGTTGGLMDPNYCCKIS